MRNYRKSVTGAIPSVKASLAGSAPRRDALALPMLF
jgi:hypothetical protein